ncbi:hypothetical protein [uncultured Pseudodesulfovibrio sp.]|uniref:hypothetical protein n=1 Tax=uncultured Pseudodesulfovibrio sp. TaxID=2035858 RepID=UPI0029C81893|nr:hypothetical protein [uncultured Pseudodesulfovibrio sp.]
MSSVHGGTIGRWFEELCRIKHVQLLEVVSKNHESLKPNSLPKASGIYAFWWTGSPELLSQRNRQIVLKGPGERPVELLFDDEWLGTEAGYPIPLYVGKTAKGINKRIGLHLRLKEKRALPLGEKAEKAKAPTTSCQLRAGVEHFFQTEEDTRTLILENVGLSYVLLDGDEHAANRFYLEDLAIGLMRPPLNVDIER